MRKIFDHQNKSNLIIYIILFFIAFMVIITTTYSPINFRRMHVDSSVYVTIAQGITRGYLPYKDFVDNKGPLLYLFNAAGLRIGGFTGIWVMELLFTFVSVLFAYKTALFFGDRLKAMLGTVFSFMVYYAFFTNQAGTEEFSMPFMMISLYIFTKYFFSPKQTVSFGELIALGSCCICAVMFRLNMFPLWAGFCMIIFIKTIIERRFIYLLKYIVGFFLGIAVIAVPLFLYLQLNGIMDAFVEQVILGSVTRGFDGGGLKATAQNFYAVINRTLSVIPLAVGLFWMIKKFRQDNFLFYLSYTLSCFLMILFLSFSSGESHYNMVIVPFFVPALTFLAGVIHSAFADKKSKTLLTAAFFCFVFSEGIANYLYDISKIINDHSGAELINTGKIIDENTKPGDTIISLGYNAYIYPFTQRDAASKYFFQGPAFDFIPGSREEFLSDILTGKPAIIALFKEKDQIILSWHQPVFDMIETDYRILSDDNGFILYIRRTP